MDNYMHALHNLSLITHYDELSKKTKHEIQELKETAFTRYQEFVETFQKNSAEISLKL